MSTQPCSDLKSRGSISIGRNAIDALGAAELTTLPLSPPDASACGRSETASRARRPLLAGAHRDLREPLTAMLRLNSDWSVRGTDMVAVRMIEQQRRALEVMADLLDSFLTVAAADIARQSEPLTDLALRPADGKPRDADAKPEEGTEEWSAERPMMSAVDCPMVPVAVGAASCLRRVLVVNEDRAVLGALRIYLLCAGYRVLAAANSDEALDRAWMTRMATSLIDIIIVDSDLTGSDDGLAVIDKTRLLLGYDVPAVLLTTQTSMEIGNPKLLTDVFLLRNPVNLDELNALIGEVLKRPRRSRLAHLRARPAAKVQAANS
jgi:CheY-like chemotaxis protein